MSETPISLEQVRSSECEPVRRSLEVAADTCVSLPLKGYAIVAIDENDAVHLHWDGDRTPLSLIGGLEMAKGRLLGEMG